MLKKEKEVLIAKQWINNIYTSIVTQFILSEWTQSNQSHNKNLSEQVSPQGGVGTTGKYDKTFLSMTWFPKLKCGYRNKIY